MKFDPKRAIVEQSPFMRMIKKGVRALELKEKKYKVIKVTGFPVLEDEIEKEYFNWGKEMKEKYGLTHLSLEDIVKAWRLHSENFCAGWLIGGKEAVEEVFGVVLEEI